MNKILLEKPDFLEISDVSVPIAELFNVDIENIQNTLEDIVSMISVNKDL